MKGFCVAITAVLVFATIYTSCSSKDTKPKKYYTIRVILDSSANFYLDSPSISAQFLRNPNIGRYIETIYDSAYNSTAYKFDSVEAGLLTIRLQSKLDRDFSKEIVLDSDTTIFFSRQDVPSFLQGNPDSLKFAEMAPGEKICIGVSSSGCFHHYTEKTIIQRKGDKYRINFFSKRAFSLSLPDKNMETPLSLNSSFKDSLIDFESSIIKHVKKAHLGFCTTSDTYHIQKGNIVYTIHDGTCSGEISYFKILRMINPDWFKPQEGF